MRKAVGNTNFLIWWVCGEGEPGRRCVAGQQLLAHYTQHGVDGEPLVCAHRGCNVNLV